jgi:hypothetical protein
LITSSLTWANAPGNLLLKKGGAKLPKPCVVNISQTLTVDKAELVECIGHLSNVSAGATRDGLRLLFVYDADAERRARLVPPCHKDDPPDFPRGVYNFEAYR